MFAWITRRSRYPYLTIPGFDTSQVRIFDSEAEEMLRKLYSEFYTRAVKDYERGILPEPPMPVDRVIERIKNAKLALVIAGKPKKGFRARLRLPRNVDLIDGIYVLDPVYMEIDEDGIGFYVLELMSARDIVSYLASKDLLDEELSEGLMRAAEECGVLNLLDLVESMLYKCCGAIAATIRDFGAGIGTLVIEMESKSLKLVVRAHEVIVEPTAGTFTRTSTSDMDMGLARTPCGLVAWMRSGNETVVIGARTWS